MDIYSVINRLNETNNASFLFRSVGDYNKALFSNLISNDLDEYRFDVKSSKEIVAGVFSEKLFVKGISQQLFLNRFKILRLIDNEVFDFQINSDMYSNLSDVLKKTFDTIGYAGIYYGGDCKISELYLLKAELEYDEGLDRLFLNNVEPDLGLLGGLVHEDAVKEIEYEEDVLKDSFEKVFSDDAIEL